MWLLYIPKRLTFHHYKNFPHYLNTMLVLKCMFLDNSTATPFCKIAWYIFFHPFAYNLLVSLNLKCVSYRRYIVVYIYFFTNLIIYAFLLHLSALIYSHLMLKGYSWIYIWHYTFIFCISHTFFIQLFYFIFHWVNIFIE